LKKTKRDFEYDDEEADGEGEFAEIGLPARPQEQLLIDRIDRLSPQKVFCTTAGRGQFARDLAIAHPAAEVTCLYHDLYPLQQAERDALEIIPNLTRVCQADLPDGEVDLVALVCSAHGIADLTRDFLQQGHDHLTHRGTLTASIDNPDDQWLHGELKKLFTKVTRDPYDEGVVYSANKTGPLAKHKNYAAEFAFRDGERIIFLHSRPGVFSHRRLDVGARALINAMTILPQLRVLDLGCGSGGVGIAAALRQPEAEVWAIDSSPRAVQCTEQGAARNGVTNLTVRLDADGSNMPAGHFDLILANPPYYSHYRIAELFLRTTIYALKPEGELLLVTKAPGWFRENLPEWFLDVDERMQKEYFVFSCHRPLNG